MRGAEETVLRPTALAEEEVAAQLERGVQLDVTDDDHDSGSQETGFAKAVDPLDVTPIPESFAKRTSSHLIGPTIRRPQCPRRAWAPRANLSSRVVDISPPPESKQRHEDLEVARDERYRPLSLFDHNDWKNRRKRSRDHEIALKVCCSR